MEIRDPKIRQQYKDAKEFIKLYEREYNKALYTETPFDLNIWDLKTKINHRLSLLKELRIGWDENHPFCSQLQHWRDIMKERLKARYHARIN